MGFALLTLIVTAPEKEILIVVPAVDELGDLKV